MRGTRRRKSSKMVASSFRSLFATARRKSTREEAKRVAMFAHIISRKRVSVPCRRSILSSGDNELRGCIVLIVIGCKLRVPHVGRPAFMKRCLHLRLRFLASITWSFGYIFGRSAYKVHQCLFVVRVFHQSPLTRDADSIRSQSTIRSRLALRIDWWTTKLAKHYHCLPTFTSPCRSRFDTLRTLLLSSRDPRRCSWGAPIGVFLMP